MACLAGFPQALAQAQANANANAQVDVAAYIRKDAFEDIKISPDGDFFAATVALEDKTGLVVLRRSDLKVTARFALGKNTHIYDFVWVNPTRLVVSMAQKFGALDKPQATGELFAVNADGSQPQLLVGQRVQGGGAGTRIMTSKAEDVAAVVVDTLPSDSRNILVGVRPFLENPYPRVEKMDVITGRRMVVTRAPVPWADFTTDNEGGVRFASGSGGDNVNKLFYRDGEGSEWKLINDEDSEGRREFALGFSIDNKVAYLLSERAQGPDAIVAYDTRSGIRTDLVRDETIDPHMILYAFGKQAPVGVMFMKGKPRSVFFDKESPEARAYRGMEEALPDEAVYITSTTADGKLALVQAWSDRNPGDFYLYDLTTRKASYLLSRRSEFDPADMASMRPIELKSRDGLSLNGYVTLPAGSAGKALPMVVMPHGGPFGVKDDWGFATESQILAKAGYAVLQVNFRGSSGYGRAFQQAGARQWGLAMQDDLTDATRWAIQQGIADPGKICIFGASYGAYAALMGVAKEPSLYRCAAGYVGVYDLPTMHGADSRDGKSSKTFANEWYGDPATLATVSPNRMADRIKVPVFLAAGGEDEIAPMAHSTMMERALGKTGIPVETLYYKTEGHGFYTEPHRLEFYRKLLAFLGKNLGGAVAKE
ncbi:MAG: S9 family peptidase [Pseudoxanthomonas sp.]